MYDEVCYKTNFLKSVIVRVDFPSPLEGLADRLPSAISKAMMGIFPRAEPTKAIAQELRLSSDELRQKRLEYTEWRFLGMDRDRTLTIIPTSVFVEYTVYENYETLRKQFLDVLSVLFSHYTDMVGKRQ